MDTENIDIRTTTDQDTADVQDIYQQSFPASENEIIVKLATELLAEKPATPVIDLIAENSGVAAGHIIFSPIAIDTDKDIRAYILAPLGVKPEHQKTGIGSKLIRQGLDRLSGSGVNIVFVYGDPAYYGRFGFSAETAEHYRPPYELDHPFGWQALILNAFGITDLPVTISCVAPLSHPELW